MLSKFKISQYKNLRNIEVSLEPLTVFVGLNGFGKSNIFKALALLSKEKVEIYNFSSRIDIKKLVSSLANILHADRKAFRELEKRLIKLVPHISGIALQKKDRSFELELIGKVSKCNIPASEISSGTLRILAFLGALYQEYPPSIICFEELENGIHPWVLLEIMEILNAVSTEGINEKSIQIAISTHSPLILQSVEPRQVREVYLNEEGSPQVRAVSTDSEDWQIFLMYFSRSNS